MVLSDLLCSAVLMVSCMSIHHSCALLLCCTSFAGAAAAAAAACGLSARAVLEAGLLPGMLSFMHILQMCGPRQRLVYSMADTLTAPITMQCMTSAHSQPVTDARLRPVLWLLPCLPSAPGDDIIPIWSVGERPIISAAAFDAAVKPNRYASAGNSGGYDNVAPALGRFLDVAHNKLWSMKASGELSAPQSHRAELDADDSIELGEECHPRLSCARESSLFSGVSDVCGLAGGVCSHGQPLLGAFMAMPAPERFVYYDLALQELLQSARVNVMYLDTGCSYSRHTRANLLAPAPLHIRTPWWHARGHGVRCCLSYSGLYLPGEFLQAVAAHPMHFCMQGRGYCFVEPEHGSASMVRCVV